MKKDLPSDSGEQVSFYAFFHIHPRGDGVAICELICGTALFLFGVSLLGDTLEQLAGGRPERALRRMTRRRVGGFLLGCGVTAVVQSSTAVTVLTAELAESGVLSLRQCLPVLMGANVGTTATAWLLWLMHLSAWHGTPAVPAALLALCGMVCYLSHRWKHRGALLLSLLLVFTGMETITAAAAPLASSPLTQSMLQLTGHPLLGLASGILLTVLVQSSSVSVGLLQAFSVGGGLTVAAAIPVVLGQNIGTCLTVFLAAAGGKRRAGQTAWAHLLFNAASAALVLALLGIGRLLRLPILQQVASFGSIGAIHTIFNLLGTAVFLPQTERLARLAERLSPETYSPSATR